MVRVNILNPVYLTDQHLVAEYLEIQMLVTYAKKYPEIKDIPKTYRLGKGHILFFKNKLNYLKKRHEIIKKEMKRRGFKTNQSLDLSKINKKLINDWNPTSKDKEIIKKRLIQKISLKPAFYRYYKEKKTKKFLIDLIKKAR